MREVNIIYNTTESVKATTIITKEDIISINLNKKIKEMSVVINQYDKNNFLVNTALYIIQNDNYDLLMSAKPSFNINKEENQYQENDIWYVIDLIRK